MVASGTFAGNALIVQAAAGHFAVATSPGVAMSALRLLCWTWVGVAFTPTLQRPLLARNKRRVDGQTRRVRRQIPSWSCRPRLDVHILPVLHGLLLAPVATADMIINMVASDAPAVDVRLPNDLDTFAEPAPESLVAVAAYPAIVKLVDDGFVILHRMVLDKMVLEALAPIADLVAGRNVTRPTLELPMLAPLVPLPVVFAAKGFVAGENSALIRFVVALLVFFELTLAGKSLGALITSKRLL